MKNHKSAGNDEISTELLKKGGDQLLGRQWKLLVQIWCNKEMRINWNKALMYCPIHKKGD